MKKLIISVLILFALVSISHAGCEVRFFEVLPDQAKGYDVILLPGGDLLPLTKIHNSCVVYSCPEFKIVKVIISKQLIADITEFTDIENPLSIQGVQALGLSSYRGEDYSDTPYVGLFHYYHELAGKKVVGVDPETGEDIETDIVRRVKWSCE